MPPWCAQVKRAVLAEYAALQKHVMRVGASNQPPLAFVVAVPRDVSCILAGGFDEAERVYAVSVGTHPRPTLAACRRSPFVRGGSMAQAPLDADSVVLPREMRVHNIEWVADGAARFIQEKGGLVGHGFQTHRPVPPHPSSDAGGIRAMIRYCALTAATLDSRTSRVLSIHSIPLFLVLRLDIAAWTRCRALSQDQRSN